MTDHARIKELESALTALQEERDRLEQRRQHQVSELLFDWREQDNILQKIAALVGDEHVTSADGVLKAIAHLTEERNKFRQDAAELRSAMALPKGPMEQQLAALTEVHERLKTLVVKWRDESMHPGRWYGNPALRGRLSACANELDALLSPREGTRSGEKGQE